MKNLKSSSKTRNNAKAQIPTSTSKCRPNINSNLHKNVNKQPSIIYNDVVSPKTMEYSKS